MLLLLAVAAAAISGSSVFMCRRPPKEPPKPSVYIFAGTSLLRVISATTNSTVCEFHHVSSRRIVANLYRMFGSVAVAGSDKEVANFYRNTVGNGGYIEFWTHEPVSALQNLFSRFQRATESEEAPAVRIHVSSKLSGMYELVLGDSTTKFLWNATNRELHKVVGTHVQLAAVLERRGDLDCLVVHRDVVNAYLAICTVVFFNVDQNPTVVRRWSECEGVEKSLATENLKQNVERRKSRRSLH